MKIKTYLQNFIKAVAIFALALLVGFPWQTVAPARVSAYTEGENLYDNTNVLEDLGEDYILKFPEVPGAEPQLNSFVEYSYSDNAFTRNASYGLYLYVYNPSRTKYSSKTGASVINMATAYNSEGNPSEYNNLPLKVCGYTTGKYDKLFYKFRIMNVEKVLNNAVAQEAKNGKRRYDVAGIQLLADGDVSAIDKGVSKSFYCSGYAKGCGKGAENESTLMVTYEDLETVELDVRHTYYRTKSSSLGVGHQNQIDTVYFAVPKRFFEKYGVLQRIKAEWYEYKTKLLAVTENSDFYNSAQDDLGKVFSYSNTIGGGTYSGNTYALALNPERQLNGINSADWVWNLNYYVSDPNEDFLDRLGLLFLTNNISDYDPYAVVTENGGVASNELYDKIKAYNKSFDKGKITLPKKDIKISADLFEDDIDASRKIDNEQGKIQQGYSYYDFDADLDIQSWLSWNDTNPDFWDKAEQTTFWQALFGKLNIPEETGRQLAPIYTLKPEDIDSSKTVAEISENLCINYNHVDDLRTFYEEASVDSDGEGNADEECVVVLFRFAVSDYYSRSVDIVSTGTGALGRNEHISSEAYIAQESVFFDFDIIQLTFNKEGVLTIIPCISNPIDIVNDITPPTDHDEKNDRLTLLEFIQIILAVIVLLFVVWAVCKVLGWVINALRRGGG